MNTRRAATKKAEPAHAVALRRLDEAVRAALQVFDQLSADDAARVKNLAGMLLARADVAPGYVPTPEGGFAPESYEQRERRREREEADAGVLAEVVTEDGPSLLVPLVRRARILSSKLRVNVERLGDPEIAKERKQEIGRAIDLAWAAFDNVKDQTKVCLELVEHVETCARGGAPAAEVIRAFQREYPQEASRLKAADVQNVLDAWNPPRGNPSKNDKRTPAKKWELFRELCRSGGLIPSRDDHPDALTLKRNWERHRPDWLKSLGKKARDPVGG